VALGRFGIVATLGVNAKEIHSGIIVQRDECELRYADAILSSKGKAEAGGKGLFGVGRGLCRRWGGDSEWSEPNRGKGWEVTQ
jgi:hypothetical protein